MDRTRELHEKEARLWPFLEEMELEGVLISKRSNFAWLTRGGDNHVFLSSEVGAASLLVTGEGKRLIAHKMDGRRIMDEELAGMGIELREHFWFEDRRKVLDELVKGKRIGCDVPTPGLEYIDKSWRDIIFPLTEPEVERVRELGRLADEAITSVCHAVEPGDTEFEVAGRLLKAYTERGMAFDVLLVGSDERPFRYRHCTPSAKRVEKHILMHVAAQKYGLHANMTRVVHFGPVAHELEEYHKAIGYVYSVILANLRVGGRFADLMERIEAAYAEVGYEGEWRQHFQGGVAGYEACEPYLLLDPRATMKNNETYDWLPTLPGTKIEELSLLTEAGAELLSVGPDWPSLSYTIDGRVFGAPDILVR